MNIQTKIVRRQKDDVQQKMYELVNNHRIETGRDPIGFIMGSNTYLDLVICLRNHIGYLCPIYPNEWRGLPIRIIRRPVFLELEIVYEDAARFAIGRLK